MEGGVVAVVIGQFEGVKPQISGNHITEKGITFLFGFFLLKLLTHLLQSLGLHYFGKIFAPNGKCLDYPLEVDRVMYI